MVMIGFWVWPAHGPSSAPSQSPPGRQPTQPSQANSPLGHCYAPLGPAIAAPQHLSQFPPLVASRHEA